MACGISRRTLISAAGTLVLPRGTSPRRPRNRGSVPVFYDKHLSYDWEKTKRVWRLARELKIPLLAGSSVPVTVRRPALEIPLGTRLTDAVVTSCGELESYGFHALEALQCMVERRAGAETGVADVELIRGQAVWKWRDGPGGWSRLLLDAALSRHPHVAAGSIEELVRDPAVFVIRYRDGLRTAVYQLDGLIVGRGFAARGDGSDRIWSTFFVEGGPPLAPEEGGTRPLPNFDGLAAVIDEFFITRRATWPIERVVLTTGMLTHLFQSLAAGSRIATPELAISYRPALRPFFQTQ